MSKVRPLTGESRLERWPVLDRLIRAGAPANIGVSDVEEVRARVSAGDGAGAEAHFGFLHRLAIGMLESYVEWARAWHAFVNARAGAEAARITGQRAEALWRQGAEAIPDLHASNKEAAAAVVHGPGRPAATLTSAVEAKSAAFCRAIADADFGSASTLLDDYLVAARKLHDLLVLYVSIYASIVSESFGQALAEQGLRDTLAACTYHGPWWDVVERLSPAELVAFLAEEFRAHFSGRARTGSVEVIEEATCYRIVFDPCGSGGVVRRAAARGGSPSPRLFPAATLATWGRAGEVPPYCAHCALNEAMSIARFGYPKWVTDFDPDPERPCGWTVFKDPRGIPAIYFTRLGEDVHTTPPRKEERDADEQ